MKLAILGTGYVGLVSGTCFAELGHDVICADINEQKIAALNRGEIPIYEPGLQELVARNAAEQRLRFTTDIPKAIRESLLIFIAVGTPPGPDGRADLRYVHDAARAIGRAMNDYKIVVDKSTVPVGTADTVRRIIREQLDQRNLTLEFDVVSNPEFLKEGDAIEDFMHPDRVVIGCENDRVRVLMQELYAHFARNGRPILIMSTRSAEMTKYAANAMLATKISFINEIAAICERVGANVDDVRNGIGSDKRIGYRFIFPGIGYGGSCFPKNVKAPIQTAEDAGASPRLLPAVDAVNETQKRSLIEKIRLYFRGDLAGRTFAVWGLAFKPETDDVREAPALLIIEALLNEGAHIRAYDPKAAAQARLALPEHPNLAFAEHHYDAAKDADAMVLCTEWAFFRNTDLDRLKQTMREPVVFDGRNVFSPAAMQRAGFDYISIGRDPILRPV